MPFQPELPPRYRQESEAELAARIGAHQRTLGPRLAILGHHYQMDEVLAFADHVGDSLKLSQIAAGLTAAEYIVFCGVHFMAESADILTGGKKTVILPDLSAGCSMADMAAIDQLETAWTELAQALGPEMNIVPVTYVNSSAAIKAFVGAHGGACCTSSNAQAVVEWALNSSTQPANKRPASKTCDHEPRTTDHGQPRLLFLPDQHLGRNTLLKMGYKLDDMAVWDPARELGGLTRDELTHAVGLLWQGHCSVHQLFTVEQVDAIRKTDPAMKVIVHPECPYEVVQKADLAGSTEYIIQTITAAPPGSRWAVGTEIHLVNRLANQMAPQGKTVVNLAGIQCLCSTMSRIDLPHLCWVLDNLAEGRVVNRIRVPADVRENSLKALERMLAHTGDPR